MSYLINTNVIILASWMILSFMKIGNIGMPAALYAAEEWEKEFA